MILTVFISLVKRDLLIAFRQLADLMNPLLFFVIVASLFAISLSPEPALLQQLAPGLIWVAALLAMLLALNNLFYHDFIDGTLEQLVLSSQPLALLILAKVTAHWLVSALPLILVTPILALFFHLNLQELMILLVSLCLGTPILSLLGAVMVVLTLGTRSQNVLMPLLLLPLTIPVLLFAMGSASAITAGLSPWPGLALLAAILTLALVSVPVIIATVLKIML